MHRARRIAGMALILGAVALFASAPAAADSYERLFALQKKIAESGDPAGQLHLGEMYELGLGTKANSAEAMKWYAKAAEKGHPHAQRRIEALRRAQEEEQREAAPARRAAEPVKSASIAPSPAATEPEAGPLDEQEQRQARREAKEREDEARRRVLVQQLLERYQKNARDPFE